MKLILDSEKLEAIVEHNGQEIPWQISALSKKQANRSTSNSIENPYLFDEINAYWATLPAFVQDAIFSCYRRIEEAFVDNWTIDSLSAALYPLVAELIDLHPIEHLRDESGKKYIVIDGKKHFVDFSSVLEWVKLFSRINTNRADVDEVFVENNSDGKTANLTYARPDYQVLVAMAVGCARVMMPIWGMFIKRTKNDAGNSFKEYRAVYLLSASRIWQSPGMNKLRIYLSTTTASDRIRTAAILSGVSTSSLPDWLLGLTLVRRLATAPLSGGVDQPSLIAYIHNYIGHRVNRDTGFDAGITRDKKPEASSQDSEQKLSHLETYKIKQENPADDAVSMGVYIRRYERMYRKLDPSAPIELFREALTATQQLRNESPRTPQIQIMQMMIYNAVSHEGISEQTKEDIIPTMAVALALLWHRGYYEIAGLMSGIAIRDEDEMNITMIDSRARLTQENLNELIRLYPYTRPTTSKQRIVPRQTNLGCQGIDTLADQFGKNPWHLTLPPSWVEKLTGNRNERYYTTPREIINLLAKLVIDNVNRSK